MPLAPRELQDPGRVDLFKSVVEAIKHPMPAGPTEPIGLDALLEKMILGALRKLDGRRGGKGTHAVLPSSTTGGPLQKGTAPNQGGADDSTRGLIKSALAGGRVIPGARRRT